MHSQRESSVGRGLIFSPHTKLYLSSQDYVVPYKISYRTVIGPLQTARALASEVDWSIGHMNISAGAIGVLKRNLGYFTQELGKIRLDLDSFLISRILTT